MSNDNHTLLNKPGCAGCANLFMHTVRCRYNPEGKYNSAPVLDSERGRMAQAAAESQGHTLDWATLEWSAKWIEGSLVGEISERVVEFGKNMVMSLRAAKPPIDFSCHVCGIQCGLAPDPPARAVCPEHCDDHDYVYDSSRAGKFCQHCDQEEPMDWR